MVVVEPNMTIHGYWLRVWFGRWEREVGRVLNAEAQRGAGERGGGDQSGMALILWWDGRRAKEGLQGGSRLGIKPRDSILTNEKTSKANVTNR